MQPTVVSLFSGCGGLDLGFVEAGFRVLYAADNDEAAVAVYRENIGPHAYVRDVRDHALEAELEEIGRCDVVLGGFPCQGFSKAGPKRADDPRNQLYRRMFAAIDILKPSLFIGENVDGIQQNFGGHFLEQIRTDAAGLGYSIEVRLLDAASFGVPQHRRRVIIVGSRVGSGATWTWPTATHAATRRNGDFRDKDTDLPLFEASSIPPLLPARTIADAIADIQELSAPVSDHVVVPWPERSSAVMRAIGEGQKLCNVRHAPSSVYTWQIPEVFGSVTDQQVLILETIARHRRHKKYGSIPNGNPLPEAEIRKLTGLRSISSDIRLLLEKGYLKTVGTSYDLKGAMFCSGLFKRPRWQGLSPTVLTNFYNPRYFLHPRANRPFTLRECARLQSFPDTFRFLSGSTVDAVDGYRLVGNAVPPRLAAALAASAMAALRPSAAARVA